MGSDYFLVMKTRFSKIILIFFVFVIIFSQSKIEADIIENTSVTISAKVVSSSGGGGGGGGSSGVGNIEENINFPGSVNFSGMAYPLSRVYILKDGDLIMTTIADQSAHFSGSLSGLSTDTYTFSIYSEDSNGRKSSFFSFPIYITEGTTVNIGNIFLSPTIDIDKIEVKKGDNLIIFGQSVPEKEIIISVHSDQELFYKVMTNSIGAYLYNLDTSILEMGKHQTKSKTNLSDQISLYTTPVSFLVGFVNKNKDEISCSLLIGDLNCDNHINLIDFSIMAFWYKKNNPPPKIDLNNDGKITLIDFSIMAFNWTN